LKGFLLKSSSQVASIILLLLTVTVAAEHAVSSQVRSPETVVMGTVYDANRAFVAGARVVARDSLKHDFQTISDAEGVYRFELPNGVYRIEANADGFCPRRTDNFRSFASVLDFTLEVQDDRHRCKQTSMLKKQPATRAEQDQLKRIAE
jgi:hypothetical protein